MSVYSPSKSPSGRHTHNGNCQCDACYLDREDVCPLHDEPRGECSECGPCMACRRERES